MEWFAVSRFARCPLALAPAWLVLAVALPVNAQQLWNRTEYGMSVAEVRAVVPKVSEPTKPSQLTDGSRELLRLDRVEVVGKPFHASFYFKAGRLSQVTLSLGKGHDSDDAMRVLKSLTDALRMKYGSEISRDERPFDGIARMATVIWASGRTNITVFVVGVGDNDATLNINYQRRLADESDKL